MARLALVRRWQTHATRAVELWRTGCIVTQPPGTCVVRSRELALINPANEGLSGVANFPYFPRGGPAPAASAPGCTPLNYATSWGGMDAGSGMIYPAQAVDGVVHALGGKELAHACLKVPEKAPGLRCSEGRSSRQSALCASCSMSYEGAKPSW